MKGGALDLRLGRWQDVLADVRADSLICDPPYSERTHKGQRSGETHRHSSQGESKIAYAPITAETVAEFVEVWAARVRRWFVIFSDHIGVRLWLDALDAAGFYTFAPVVWVKTNSGPRFSGDGPASSVEYLAIARTRKALSREEMRSRPGYYKSPIAQERAVVGGKPLRLMRAVVRDYSQPGNRIVDPFAGGATTLLAARIEGRIGIGAEQNQETFTRAGARIAAGYTPALL